MLNKYAFLTAAVLLILISVSSASAVTITNGIYQVTVQDDGGIAIGTYTAATDNNHPDPDENILYGGVDQQPWSTYLTVRDESNNIEYISSADNDISPSLGYTLVHLDTCNPQVTQIGTNQIDTLWQVLDVQGSPVFNILQSIQIMGTTYEDSIIIVTTNVTNLDNQARNFSIRYLWDIMIASSDDAQVRPVTAGGDWSTYEREWINPSFSEWEATDIPASPNFSIYGSINNADRLAVTDWDDSYLAAFDYTIDPTKFIDDSAILYYWLDVTLQPEQTASVSSAIYAEPAPTTMSDIAVTKDVNKETVHIGELLEYEITVRNNGPDEATNIMVNEILPEGLSLEGIQTSQGVFDPDTGIWTVGDLEVDDFATLILEVLAEEVGVYTNEVTATADQDDPDLTNNLDSETITVSDEETAADLEVTKESDRMRYHIGDLVTFWIDVYNWGPDTAENVEVADFLSPGLTLIDYDLSTGYLDEVDMIWYVGDLEAEEGAWLELICQANSLGWQTNTVVVTSDTYDPYPDDNTDTATIGVIPPARDRPVPVPPCPHWHKPCIPMQPTGTPFTALGLGLLSLTGGLAIFYRRSIKV